MRRRLAAIVALLAGLATAVLAVVVSVSQFPRGLGLLACVVIAALAAWYGVLRRGTARVAGLVVAGLALAGALVLVIVGGRFGVDLIVVAGLLVTLAAARASFAAKAELPRVDAPLHPVLFYNPLSGGGKAERFALAKEARARGIEPIELTRGTDLEVLVRGAVERGADGLAMAGGDGSQAVVAAIAAEYSLPYACIPAGTRNHFALDLGVDRDDVVGALDAFVEGGERLVDLAEVNGRVFVNNVSLGVYAAAVQRPGYRAAKMRMLLKTLPEVVSPRGVSPELHWVTPGGRERRGPAVILVGNGQYRLGGAAGAGTRPAMDRGLLGITVLDPPSSTSSGPGGRLPWRQWSVPEFRVDARGPVPVGIDGEPAVLAAPLSFRVRPTVLRVRIAAHHPGASPSAIEPVGALAALRELARIAAGRVPRQMPVTAVPTGSSP